MEPKLLFYTKIFIYYLSNKPICATTADEAVTIL